MVGRRRHRDAAPSRCRWRPSSVPRVVQRGLGHRHRASARSGGGGRQPRGVRGRRRRRTLPPVELVEGSWLDPLPGAAARPRRPGGVEPAVRDRGGVGGARPRGAGRAAPGPGRRSGGEGAAGPGRRGGRARAGPRLARPAPVPSSSSWRRRRPDAAARRARQLGYDEVRVEPDLAGRPRARGAAERLRIGTWP